MFGLLYTVLVITSPEGGLILSFCGKGTGDKENQVTWSRLTGWQIRELDSSLVAPDPNFPGHDLRLHQPFSAILPRGHLIASGDIVGCHNIGG